MLKPIASTALAVFMALAAACSTPHASPPSAAAPDPAAPAKPQKRIEEKDLAAYLFVYFKDEHHSLCFALSRDGYTFADINGGKPVMDGTKLAEQKGIRDPHIVRGPDGAFYLTMTDLHIYGQRAGFRSTQWERPQELYDWGNNRAIVLMKSADLIDWSHAIFRIDRAFEETRDVGCIWAPQSIYDPGQDKMMVYFTMRLGHGKTKLYYSYADDAFTKLETVPVEYFQYPPATRFSTATSPKSATNTTCSTAPRAPAAASSRPSPTRSTAAMFTIPPPTTPSVSAARRPPSGAASAPRNTC